MSDLADLLVEAIRDTAAARYEAYALRGWLRAALHELHERHVDVERERATSARLREELRAIRGDVAA